jgi:hypothetical protein
MDGKGRATDNICIERFWRSAKCERIYLNEYQSISELMQGLFSIVSTRLVKKLLAPTLTSTLPQNL